MVDDSSQYNRDRFSMAVEIGRVVRQRQLCVAACAAVDLRKGDSDPRCTLRGVFQTARGELSVA